MSLRTNLLYIMFPIAFPLFFLGAETREPREAIIPAKIFKTCTNVQLGDAVHLSQDIYEICCNSPNIFFRRTLPILPVCDANLLVKRKNLQVMYNEGQKRHSISDLAQSFWFPKSSPRSRSYANNTSAAIMSGECMFPSTTPKLGDVYGNCSGLYQENSSDICLGACGPLEPLIMWPFKICRVKTRNDNCQMASGEMRRVTTISCQCSS